MRQCCITLPPSQKSKLTQHSASLAFSQGFLGFSAKAWLPHKKDAQRPFGCRLLPENSVFLQIVTPVVSAAPSAQSDNDGSWSTLSSRRSRPSRSDGGFDTNKRPGTRCCQGVARLSDRFHQRRPQNGLLAQTLGQRIDVARVLTSRLALAGDR